MKPRILIPAFLAAWMLLPAPVLAQSLADDVARVERLIAEKHPQEALDLARRLVTTNPTSDQAWWAQARARRELGDVRGTLDDYSKAIAINPANVRAYTGRAFVLDTLGRRDEALRDVNRSIAINPRYPNAYDTQAMLEVRAGDTKGALEDCDRAIAIDPTFVSAWERRVGILRSQGNYDAVIRDATAALARSPNLSAIIAERGYAFLQLKRYRESIGDYTRCIEAGHDLASSYNARAYAHRMLGELLEALADVQKSLALLPGDTSANQSVREATTRNLREIQAMLPAGAAATSAQPAKPDPARSTMLPASKPPSPPGTVPMPSVRFTAGDPCSTANRSTTGTPWQKPSLNAKARAVPATGSVVLSVRLDLQTPSRAQYAGAVSTAYEGMRLVYGPMSPEDTQAFESVWAPLFNYPSSTIVTYLNTLNPLLAQFLAGREAMMRAAAGYEVAVLDASLAVGANQRAGWDAAMADATRQASVMRSLQGGLSDLARRIEALGNPPNPLEAKCNARRRHQEALDAIGAAEEPIPLRESSPATWCRSTWGQAALIGPFRQCRSNGPVVPSLLTTGAPIRSQSTGMARCSGRRARSGTRFAARSAPMARV
jgi:tetratricopeptide (TPR) repeat protein